MSDAWIGFLTWFGWLSLWGAVIGIFLIFADPPGYRGRRRKPARVVVATASVAAVISGWQPRISRVP